MFHRHSNPAPEMLASGQWSKQGRNWVHVSGVVVESLGDGRWQVGQWVYGVLYAARDAVEYEYRKKMAAGA